MSTAGAARGRTAARPSASLRTEAVPGAADRQAGKLSAARSAALVPAVERACRLLDLLALVDRAQPLAELARRLGLPKSSLHGLLHTLSALGLAMRDARGEYRLGPKALHWAQAFERQSNVIEAFERSSRALGALAEETVMLAVLDGADVLYLACRPGSRALGVTFRVGGRFPACFTSSGKAMLATLPAARLRDLFGDGLPAPLTRSSVTSIGALERQLHAVRERGYAIDDEETAEGMHCFGAPVFGPGRREAAAAVAVSLIKASTTPQRHDEVLAAITMLARDVSRRLGSGGTDARLAAAGQAAPGTGEPTARGEERISAGQADPPTCAPATRSVP